MVDLQAEIAGIHSPNPFWLASGPPTNTADQVMRAFDAGWGGAVWKTVGQPVENVSSRYGGLFYKGLLIGMNNIELISDRSIEDNLREIQLVKKRYPNHALVVSLMFGPKQEWQDILKRVEDTGADGVELNFGCPHGMCERGMGSAVGQEPKVLAEITSWVRECTTLPVLVKLTPNVTDILEPALAAQNGGAHGVSLINTVQSLMGVDLDKMVPYPIVHGKSTFGGYCGPAVKPIGLHMVARLGASPQFRLPVSGIGGISNWKDAAEYIALGAHTVQVCTAVMQYGFRIVQDMIDGLTHFMEEKGYKRLEDFRGKALLNYLPWGELDLNYRVVAEIDETRCTGCLLCYIACYDGTYQAIERRSHSPVPKILKDKCVGCNLCSLICPEQCISMVPISSAPYLSWREKEKGGSHGESGARRSHTGKT